MSRAARLPRPAAGPVPDAARIAEMHSHAGDAAQLLKALGNEQRLLVLCNLLAGPLSVGELNERVELSQSALSQHLAVLREDELVATRRESQTIYYRVASEAVASVLSALHGIYCRPRAPAPTDAPVA